MKGKPPKITPEDLLKTVRLAMPNLIRNEIFSEQPMAAPNNSVYYIKPVFGKPYEEQPEAVRQTYSREEFDKYIRELGETELFE